MKYPRLVCICALCASPVLLRAGTVDGIQMLSQSYNISASWNVDWLWSPTEPYNWQPYPAGDWSAGYDVSPSGEITGGYDLSSTDGSPVTATTACASPLGGSPLIASASIGRFSMQNNADSTPDNYVFPNPEPLGGYVLFQGAIQTSAQADWLFSPVGTSLQVGLNGSLNDVYGTTYGNFSVTLSDVTSSTTLLSLAPSTPRNSFGGDYTFAVNPNHVYELNISGWSNTYDDDFTTQSVTASLTSVPITFVPEPGVNCLLSLGLAGFLALKNRLRRA